MGGVTGGPLSARTIKRDRIQLVKTKMPIPGIKIIPKARVVVAVARAP